MVISGPLLVQALTTAGIKTLFVSFGQGAKESLANWARLVVPFVVYRPATDAIGRNEVSWG